MSDYIGLVGAALATLVALFTVAKIAPLVGLKLAPDRSASIDGLRGYAAFFVFLCHATAWFYYVRTDRWAIMPLRLYGNLGSASVVVFFMITAFLFTMKLLDARGGEIDWLRLFVSRVMRLTPLYLFAMCALLLVLGATTGFELNEPASTLLSSLVDWLGFTILGSPDLNGFKDTWLIIAGVTWSLPFEIFFYLLLPLLAVMLGARARYVTVGATATLAFLILMSRAEPMLAMPFLGGAVAAWLVRIPRLAAAVAKPPAAALAIAGFFAVGTLFWGAFKPLPVMILSISFFVVAAGNPLFGVLTNRAARLLGEISYSMYLLHAIALFVLVRWGIGAQALAAMSPVSYWTIIVLSTPVLVTLCSVTYVLIERPGIEGVSRITRSLRRRYGGHRPIAN